MPFLKLNQSTPTSMNASEEPSWSDERIQETLINLERSNKTALLQSISEKHHGTMSIIDLRNSASRTSNTDTMQELYFLTKPIFFGQLVKTSRVEIEQRDSRDKELAFILNCMLEIYYGKTGEFIHSPKNGQMHCPITVHSTGAYAFLLKAYPQLIFPVGDEDAATAFLIALYEKHFLCQFLSKETVALIHFPNPQDRENALNEILKLMKEEMSKMGAEKATPSCPMVIENTRTEKDDQKILRLFVIDNYTPTPVGSKADIPNFATAYTLAEINRHTFMVGTKERLTSAQGKAKIAYLYEQRLFPQLLPECRAPISGPRQLMTHSHASIAKPNPQLNLFQQPQPIQRQLGSKSQPTERVGGSTQLMTHNQASMTHPSPQSHVFQQQQPGQRYPRSMNPPTAQAYPNHATPIENRQSRTFRLNIHAQPFTPCPSTTTNPANVVEDSTTSSLKF